MTAKAGSVGALAIAGSSPGSLTPSDYYTPVSNLDSSATIALDTRDIAPLLNNAKTDASADWAQLKSLYEQVSL